MSQPAQTLADQIIRIIEINRTTINGLGYGKVIFQIHQGRLVEITASETLRVSAGVQLNPLSLKSEES